MGTEPEEDDTGADFGPAVHFVFFVTRTSG